MAQAFRQAIGVLPQGLREPLDALPHTLQARITEVRLRVGAPLVLTAEPMPLFLSANGQVVPQCIAARIVTANEVEQTFLCACDYSVFRHQPEVRQGFLTLEGGHRLGIAGVRGVEGDFERVTSLNLRIARTIAHAADVLCSRLFADGLCSPILAGPPLCGKTTILRALATRLADGSCGQVYRVCVVDSRREFGSLPQCDVLAGFPKAQGLRMALQSLSPQVLLCDEIAQAQQVQALQDGFAAGAACAVSVHAAGEDALFARTPLRRLMETGQFTHVVLLDPAAPGRIGRIFTRQEWPG